MFTDWAGLKMGIADPQTREVREVSVFVAALGASQYVSPGIQVDQAISTTI